MEHETTQYILSYKQFYHVTPIENVYSICEKGLIPNKYPDNMFLKVAPFKKAQICLCPIYDLKNQKDSVLDKSRLKRVAVYSIDSSILISKELGLDYTFSGTELLIGKPELEQFKRSIEEFMTLACFEIIEFCKINRIG